jgi:hypothetical protein
MQQQGIDELDAAFKVAEKIDRARGITPLHYDDLLAAHDQPTAPPNVLLTTSATCPGSQRS